MRRDKDKEDEQRAGGIASLLDEAESDRPRKRAKPRGDDDMDLDLNSAFDRR
jgi:hypothetical protein